MSHYDVDTESLRTDMLSVASSPSNASTATLTTVAGDDPPPYSLIESANTIEEVDTRQWARNDPRSSSTQSLGQHEAPPESKRKLLLVYIHGFMGAETSFQSYPAHVHNLVTILLGESHVVNTKVYPRYRSRKAIQVATNDFSSWLAPHETPDTDIILVGHSLGGILAAEVALLPSSPFNYSQPLRHRILGTINFDTPFLGMHPGVVKSGIGSLFRPAPSPPKSQSPYLSRQTSASSSSSGSFPFGQQFDALRNSQPEDPNFNPSFANDVLLPVRTGWRNAQHFLRKHSKNIVTATSSLVASHLEFGGCLADYDGLRSRYCKIRMLEEDNELSRLSVVAGARPAPRVRFANYYTASTGRHKTLTNPTPQPKATQSLPTHTRPPSFTSISTPSIASTELPPYESEAEDFDEEDENEDMILSDESEEEPADPNEDTTHDSVLETESIAEDASVISTAGPSDSTTTLPPVPQAPQMPTSPPFPTDPSYDRLAYRNSLTQYYKEMRQYHQDLKKYHNELRAYRHAERKRMKREHKESINALKEELKRLTLAEHKEGTSEDTDPRAESLKDEQKRLADSLKSEQKQHADLIEEERKKESEKRKSELKELVQVHKETRKNEMERRKAEHKAWRTKTKEDHKAAWEAVKTEHKARMEALSHEKKDKGKAAHKHCPRTAARAATLSSSTLGEPLSLLESPSHVSLDSIPSSVGSMPRSEGSFPADEKKSDALPKPKDKKFCNLPPKDASGGLDPTWIRVFMEGVDEVGAHCGLFFPTLPTESEDSSNDWGERYAKLVGDVAERIESWVHENLTEMMVRRERAQAALDIAAAPPLPPRIPDMQQSGVVHTEVDWRH